MSRKELWKSIIYKDLEISYEVSDYGRVRNKNIRKISKQKVNDLGYITALITVKKQKILKHIYIPVHKEVAQAFIPNPKNLEEVNHKDKNPRNNKVDNLEWCHSGSKGVQKTAYGYKWKGIES
jgi:hypothetical protein